MADPADSTTTSTKPAPKKSSTPKPTAEDYGYTKAFLKAHPDVAAVVRRAVAHGYTPQRFAAEVKGTEWWRHRSDAQRSWDLLTSENPGEQTRQIKAKTAAILSQAKQMGITMSPADAKKYATTALRNNMDTTEVTAHLGSEFHLPGAGTALRGTASEVDTTLSATAAQYGVAIDSKARQQYIQQVLSGNMDVNGFEDIMREQAKVAYPSIAKQLDAGITVQQYLTPYLSYASNELGIPVQAMNLSDTKWTKGLSGGGGKHDVPMSMDEWTRTVRNDPTYRWNETLSAKQQGAQLGSQLQRLMGAS